MKENLIIIIGGGSRGIGKSLLKCYSNKNYDTALFHRSCEKKDSKNFFFDIDIQNSLEHLKIQLLKLIEDNSYSKFSIHFLSGGGLGVDFLDDSENSFKKVLQHNLIVPTCLTSKIFNYVSKRKDKNFELFYYSSAVVNHLKASPYYVSAKSALESMFKSTLMIKPSSVKMYLLRMGIVDIEHKYFHKLYINDKSEFKRLVLDNIPSKYFTKADEIAHFALKISENENLMDGSICDISGGHSWK